MSRESWEKAPPNRRWYLMINANGEIVDYTRHDQAAASWCHNGRGCTLKWIETEGAFFPSSPSGLVYSPLWGGSKGMLYTGVGHGCVDHTPTGDE